MLCLHNDPIVTVYLFDPWIEYIFSVLFKFTDFVTEMVEVRRVMFGLCTLVSCHCTASNKDALKVKQVFRDKKFKKTNKTLWQLIGIELSKLAVWAYEIRSRNLEKI